MSLHTLAGCTSVGANQTSTLVNSTDCSFSTNSNQGCVVTDPSVASYGAGFAAANGGVFITEFAESGISYVQCILRPARYMTNLIRHRVWFFPRANVPSSISSNGTSINTATLGTPVANWPSTGCNSNQYFAPQNLIFDITLCGGELDPFSTLSLSPDSDYIDRFCKSSEYLLADLHWSLLQRLRSREWIELCQCLL